MAGNTGLDCRMSCVLGKLTAFRFTTHEGLGPQKHAKSWPFGLCFKVLGQYVTYLWGPGSRDRGVGTYVLVGYRLLGAKGTKAMASTARPETCKSDPAADITILQFLHDPGYTILP